MFGCYFIANVRFPIFSVIAPDSTISDYPPVFLRQRDGKLEFSSRLLLLLVKKQLHEFLGFRFRSISSGVKPQVTRVTLVPARQAVLKPELTQEHSFCNNLHDTP
jgi:hypothetical protein